MTPISKAEDKDANRPDSREKVTIQQVQAEIRKSDDQVSSVVPLQESAKDTISEETKKLLNPQSVGILIDSLSGMAAKSWGDHWKFEEYERDSISEALCNYLNIVLPQALREQPELFALVTTTAIIILPRVMKTDWKRKSGKDKGDPSGIDAANPGEQQKSNGTDLKTARIVSGAVVNS